MKIDTLREAKDLGRKVNSKGTRSPQKVFLHLTVSAGIELGEEVNILTRGRATHGQNCKGGFLPLFSVATRDSRAFDLQTN